MEKEIRKMKMVPDKEHGVFSNSAAMGFQPSLSRTLKTASVASFSSTPSATTQMSPSFGMVWERRPIMLLRLRTMPSRYKVRVD